MKQSTTVDVLGIAAHPDDVELSAAGTMLMAKRAGKKTGILDLTRGELSTRGTLETRAKETEDASKILQLDARINLGLHDGNIEVSHENMLKVVRVLRQLRPIVLLAPYRFERHPDHEAASELAHRAVFYAGLAKIETVDDEGNPQQPHRPLLVMHFMQTYSFEPTVIIDISDVFPERMKAMEVFASQFARDQSGRKLESKERDTFLTQKGFYEWIEARSRHFGMLIGAEFGEPFWTQEAVGTKDVFSLVTKEDRIKTVLKFPSHIAFVLSLAVAACSPPPDLTHKDCTPPPPPACRPGTSNAVGIDTSTMQAGYFKYHIDLLPKQINTDNNENAIAFFPNGNNYQAFLSAEKKESNDAQKLYTSPLLPDLHFDPVTEINGAESYSDIGTAMYCAADGRVYFTAKAENDDPNDYDLYSARVKQNGNTFSLDDLTSISVLNKPVSFEAQPALSKDGLMIVFASDRAGGHEGVDLWYSTRSSVSSPWNEPKDLPSEINTPCNELSPSFSADGKKLFFSSDGHETIGGYDLFSSIYSNGSWSKAENLGTPVNTRSDEIFPYQLTDSQFFYTSDEPCAYKGRNIFVLRRTYLGPKDLAQIPKQVIPEKNIPDSIELKGRVEMPEKRDSVLPEVFVRDVQKNKEIARKKTDTVGNYAFTVEKGREYDVGSDRKDKFYDVHRVDLRHPTDSIISVPPLVIPDTLVLRINFPFNDDTHPYDFTIDEAGQKTDVRWQSSLDLLANSIKKSSKSLQSVILYGHTDSLGTDEYNNALAERRAEFVAKQLKARGIPAKLLVIFSKGRTMPVMRRAGESDETFYLRCRRVEFVKYFSKESK